MGQALPQVGPREGKVQGRDKAQGSLGRGGKWEEEGLLSACAFTHSGFSCACQEGMASL